MGKIPKIRLGKCLASLLPRRTGMSGIRVNLQGEAEEVWISLMRGTGSFANHIAYSYLSSSLEFDLIS